MDEYFVGSLIIDNKIKVHGERTEQTIIVKKILRSMTPNFNYILCSIEEFNDLSVMTINELQSSLLVHEQRMQGQKEEEHALNIINSKKIGGLYEHIIEKKKEFMEVSGVKVEARVGNLTTKHLFNATIARDQGIFNMNVLVKKRV